MKPYELTDEEISKIVSDNYDADSWDSSESAAKGAESAAQKKLLEYMLKEVFNTRYGDYTVVVDKLESLLKDFGYRGEYE